MNKKNPLSITQVLIVRSICAQKTSEEIGRELGRSKRTIEEQRRKICKILGVKNTVGIVMSSITNGIVPQDMSLKLA